mmetsp:Transcript_33278/g.58316  ORF Transcript_33278/g.58316 Transcript_33278/m.58316 type:complete len:216 (+) Transcript_33278:206-853(+)
MLQREGPVDEVVLHVDDHQAAHGSDRPAEPRAPRRAQLIDVHIPGGVAVERVQHHVEHRLPRRVAVVELDAEELHQHASQLVDGEPAVVARVSVEGALHRLPLEVGRRRVSAAGGDYSAIGRPIERPQPSLLDRDDGRVARRVVHQCELSEQIARAVDQLAHGGLARARLDEVHLVTNDVLLNDLLVGLDLLQEEAVQRLVHLLVREADEYRVGP